MSRTYRNPRKHTWWSNNWHLNWQEKQRPKNKEELAREKRDGGLWKEGSHHWYFNQIARTGRTNAREQFNLLRKCEDWTEFSFDPSRHIKKHRSVWWDIY